MTLLTALLLTATISTSQEPKTYSDDKMDLKFQYPAEWELDKRKYDDVFRFDTAEGSEATVQVISLFFRQEKAKWQEIQRTVAGQMGRRVARQWEEQILGVPLLMTRLEFNEDSQEQVVLVGLLYVAREQKMSFRVNSTLATAAEAEKVWRNALLTLRTVSGELPIPDDPTKPLPNASQNSDGESVKTFRANENKKPVRTSNKVSLTKLGRDLDVHMSNGWTLSDEDGRMSLKHEKLKGKVQFEISVGGRTQAVAKLREANKTAFERFNIVSLRVEPRGAISRSGAYVLKSLRVGTTPNDTELCLWYIVGASDTVIWKLNYEVDSLVEFDSDKKLMNDLAKLFAVVVSS